MKNKHKVTGRKNMINLSKLYLKNILPSSEDIYNLVQSRTRSPERHISPVKNTKDTQICPYLLRSVHGP
jgi:hypothetical protein